MSTIKDRVWAVDLIPASGRAARYERLKTDFDVSGSSGKDGTCRLTVTMPPRGMLGQLADPDVVVRVLAGTAATGLVEIHSGRIAPKGVERRRAGTPTVSVVTHASSTLLRRTMTEYLPGRGTLYDAAVAVAAAVGAAVESIDPSLQSVTFRRGYALVGDVATVLDEICESTRCRWSLESGSLAIWPHDEPRSVAVDIWQPGSGLLDVSATAGHGEIRARALLRPAIRAGSIVRLRSDDYQGDIVVQEYGHRGGSHSGGTWETSIVGVPRGV